jgi:threonine dehydratase
MKDRYGTAREIADAHGATLVPPFDHPWIVAGQGTTGLEIVEDLNDVQNILVCVGGGGLISGIATVLAATCPKAQIIGVEPELAADAAESFEAGRLISWSADRVTRTVADGVRTQSLGELNFALIREHVSGFVTVSEEAIREKTRWYALEAKLVVEPTGALTLAAYDLLRQKRAGALSLKPGKTVLLISGGNIDPPLLTSLLSET